MQLMPRRIKYRKSQRGTMKGVATRGNRVVLGEFGLMSLETSWINAKLLETGRLTASHFMGGEGRFYIRLFPHKPISGKPAETRMGKGKGETNFYAAIVKPGTIMFEIGGVTEDFARQCFNRIAHKMPVRTKMVLRRKI